MQRVRSVLLLVSWSLFASLPASSFAETYDYDAVGRVSRITASDGTATRYIYDALGNLVSVTVDEANLPPIVTAVAPTKVLSGSTERIEIQGENLAGAAVIAPSTAFAVSGLVSADQSLAFTLETDNAAPLGEQVFRVRNLDGEATFTLNVSLPAPTIGVRPLPLALPEDGSLRRIIVTLSRAETADRTVMLEMADPGIAELQAASVTIPAGETESMVGIRGLSGGVTRLTLTSAGIETATFSVYVTGEYGSINSKYSDLLGIQVGIFDGGGSGEVTRAGWSDRIGVVLGPMVTGVAPGALSVGAVSQPLTIHGVGLQNAEALGIQPADGVTLADFGVLDDGSAVQVSVSVDPGAVLGPRRLVLSGVDQPYAAAEPGADLLDIVAPTPVIDSLDPNLALRGTTAGTLIVRGRNLAAALAVEFDPSDGIDVGNDRRVSEDGTSLTLSYSIAADALLGDRLVRVATPAGSSTGVVSASNRFQVVDQVVGERSPILAPVLGIQVAGSAVESQGEGHAFAPPLGLVLGSIVSSLSPSTGVVGTLIDLEIAGHGLESTSEVRFEPTDGIAVDALVVDPLGEGVLAQLSIAHDAPETVRQVRVFGSQVEIPFAEPAASRFLVTAPRPLLQAVSPNTLKIGAGVDAFTLYGTNLDRASRVDAQPPEGVVIGVPTVSPDGTRITVSIEAQAGATAGDRVLSVTTPAGTTAATPSVVNTLTLYDEALAMPTPVVAPMVGIEVGEGTGGLARPIDALVAPLVGIEIASEAGPQPSIPALVPAPLLGVTVGPFAAAVNAPPLMLGHTYTLSIEGASLGAVDGVGIFPGFDLAVGTPVPNADGSSLILTLTIPSDAALGPRTLRIVAGSGQVLFADPAAAILELAAGVPEIDSIQPIVGEPGDVVDLVVRGRNLQWAKRVLAEPADGLQFDSQLSANAAGTEVRVRLHLEEDAPLGARTIRVETPGGTSTAAASAANTFTLY